MARLSSVDRLAPQHRDAIARWRRHGHTINAIHTELGLRGAMVSRSAIARHVKKLDAAGGLGLVRELMSMRKRLARVEAAIAELVTVLHEGRLSD